VKLKSLLSSVIRKLWLSFAILLVTMALILSAIRVSLPYANDFKDQLASWFEQKFDQAISIDELNASWQGLGPQIEMIGFQFERQAQFESPVMVNISQVNLELDFWQTILQRSFVVKNFVLDGVEVLVDIDKLDAAKQSGDDFALFDLFQDIFLEQFKRFNVENSYVTIVTPDKAAHQVTVHQLKWFNRGAVHQGVGDFSLEGIEEDKLGFVLDLSDDGNENYSGRFYVKSDGVDFASWIKPYLSDRAKDIQSRLKFEAWLDIENNTFGEFLLNFDPSPMSWYLGNQLQQFELVSGRVLADFESGASNFYFDDLSFATGEQLWSGLNVNLGRVDKGWQIYSPQIILNPLKAVSSLFSLPDKANEFINALHGDPSIENFHLTYQSADDWQLNTQIIDLNWQEVLSIPEMNGLSAQISAKPGQIVADWSVPETELAWQNLFTEKLEINSAKVSSVLLYDKSSWQLKLPHFRFDLKQIQLDGALAIQPNNQGSLDLSVYSEIGPTQVTDVYRFLPQKRIGEKTFSYLDTALQGGIVRSGQLIWQGALTDFPFDKNQGIFKAQLKLENSRFEFQPNWPAADDIDLTLTFENRALYFSSQHASLMQAELLNLEAKIDDLASKEASLDLFASVQAQGPQVREVMQNSSLKNSVGTALEQAQVKGLVKVNLDLYIPLHDSKNLNASGEVLFNQNEITITQTGFVFQRVNGLLEFNMDKLVGKKMTFDWGPVPYQVDVKSEQTAAGYQLGFDLRGNWPVDAILTQSGFLNMADRVRGNAHIDGHLDMLFGSEQGLSYKLNVASDLHGVTLRLPEPYQKSAEKIKITNLLVEGNDERALIELSSGNDLSFNSVLPYELARFSRAYLVLGENVLSAPGTGFNISAHLNRIELIDYIDLVNDLNADLSQFEKNGEGIIGLPERIKGEVENLGLGPLDWHSVIFDVYRKNDHWNSQVFADEFRGEIKAFDNWQKQGLDISAEQLYLLSKPKTQVSDDADPESDLQAVISSYSREEISRIFSAIPPVKFNCEQCMLDQKNLGKVSFEVVRTSPNDLVLNDFAMKYRQHSVTASGLWRLDNQARSTTQLRGEINSSDFGLWLRDYQLSSAIRDSSIKADFAFNWPQAPMDLSYQYFNGTLNWRLGEGYLTEVSDKGARLLSMLSLDSLVRKLKLDFRDVFSKGLFYNQMKGSIKLTNGLAYTDNTVMDGVAGNMEVKGSTDLVSQKLNYDVRFSPKITSSLPVLIAWMVNPVTGIAALAIDQVIESADVISQIKFKISGTIDQPEVIETGRESRAVKLPKNTKAGK